ncbi:putative secreted protein [Microbacterium esteraromaticum]|uniref:Putative secreted protein n=1 Tax=Microbacterium esteraromaticum TaxID=57043 RepID=A0A1R4K272_9MICO|nr:beta-propeller fold lactonase family protein [Microbacterium esteraromaticum]SJN38308.1 putative secreted protein [Microbacterium esteraromaticum]
MTRFWVGGYGSDQGGDAEGIGLLAVDEGRGASTLAYRGLAAPIASPSWLAQHPSLDVVYAAQEGAGTVQAFARSGEATLRPLGPALAAGEIVCHLSVSLDRRMLIASCYGDGRVVRYGIADDGHLVEPAPDKAAALRAALFGTRDPADLEASESSGGSPASDPYPTPMGAEPRVSRAHASVFLPDGRIATTDLGFDLVRIWRHDLTLDHEVVLPRGTGPRHMVLHPSGHLHVVTEYSCEVFTLASARDGTWGLVSATPAAEIAQIGFDFAAELTRSRDGETLYTALRGSNTIAALRVRGAGEVLEPLALADSGVNWPRHHLVYDGTLLVAGQKSNTISVLDLDERTGAPQDVRHIATAPSPSHLLPVR